MNLLFNCFYVKINRKEKIQPSEKIFDDIFMQLTIIHNIIAAFIQAKILF